MGKFYTKRIFKLDFLGQEWKDCFITFTSVSIKETRQLIKQKLGKKSADEIMSITTKFFEDHFIDGVVYDADKKEVVKMTKEEFEDMPQMIQERAILFLVGDTT